MNGTEQRARHFAVSNAERRIDDLELVLQQIAKEVIDERETFSTHLLKQHEACQDRWEAALQTREHVTGLEARETARAVAIGPGLRGRLGLVARLIRWVCTGRAWR